MQILPPATSGEAMAQHNKSCPACRRNAIAPSKIAIFKANSTGPTGRVIYTRKCPHCPFEVSQPALIALARDGYPTSEVGKPVDNHHVDVVNEMIKDHISTCPCAPVKLCTVASNLTNREFVSHVKLCVNCAGGTIRNVFSDYADASARLAVHVAQAAAH